MNGAAHQIEYREELLVSQPLLLGRVVGGFLSLP